MLNKIPLRELFREWKGLLKPPPSSPVVATYSFNGMDLRVVEIDGEPWFVAVDVCEQLGLTGSPSQHTAKLKADEKRVIEKSHGISMGLGDLFERRLPRVSVVAESGLYKLVMRSTKREAEAFKEWVTREVLPSIRKTGTYTMPGA